MPARKPAGQSAATGRLERAAAAQARTKERERGADDMAARLGVMVGATIRSRGCLLAARLRTVLLPRKARPALRSFFVPRRRRLRGRPPPPPCPRPPDRSTDQASSSDPPRTRTPRPRFPSLYQAATPRTELSRPTLRNPFASNISDSRRTQRHPPQARSPDPPPTTCRSPTPTTPPFPALSALRRPPASDVLHVLPL